MAKQINILIVDDSAVIRKILTKILAEGESFNVIGEAENGQKALEILRGCKGKTDVHVVLMDLEMPVMNGYEALPNVKKLFPKSRTIVASSLSQKGAEASIKALAAGASDYLPKPTLSSEESMQTFANDLRMKVKVLGNSSISGYNAAANFLKPSGSTEKAPKEILSLLPDRNYTPKALVIGSSTGGPEALLKLFKGLDAEKLKNIPIFVTQHMPTKFTALLAESISRYTDFKCAEGKQHEIIKPGNVYLAPGDFHMEIIRNGVEYMVNLNQGEHINFCRPSVDPMLNSLLKLYGDNLLFVMLTGMGADGLDAAKNAAEKRAVVIAQDKETSVVWGMPGAVAREGICSLVAPIPELTHNIMKRY